MELVKNPDVDTGVSGFDVIQQPIGKEQLAEFDSVLLEYQRGRASLETRIKENYKYYKLRQWEVMNKTLKPKDAVEPKSAWLFNAIANKHADAMDNFPAPNVLPREKSDTEEAKSLSAIVPVVLDQCEFEKTYSSAWWDKLIIGTSVYGVFWNKDKMNGMGDIDIKNIDMLDLFWEPGIKDIQDSRYVFLISLCDNDILEKAYPELENKLGGKPLYLTEREHDDTVDTSNKSAVVDVYYKLDVGGRVILHYCKYVGDTVLYATENNDDTRNRGIYDHGQYPFVPDVLFPNADSPAGFGYIDIGKDTQEYIDRISQAVLKNTLSGARPRYFYRKDTGINAEDYADLNKELVSYTGQSDDIVPIVTKGLDSIYLNVLESKVNELKETTGNRDISTGGTTSGVTAASAIAAMQEAGSKLSRDSAKASYRQYRQIILLVIELIRQFYDVPRSFRITGADGDYQFKDYSNEKIAPQPQGDIDADGNVIPEYGVEVGYRVPLFDVEITAQKQSPYSKMAQNELALQLYQLRFFDPNNTDAALACLDMMDFDRKDTIMQKIADNGTLLQKLIETQQQALSLAQMLDPRFAQQIAGAASEPIQEQQPHSPVPVSLEDTGEAENTKRARQRTAEMTAPM